MAGPQPNDDLLASLQQSVFVIDRLESELARTREDVAIIGMSCRFPSADSPAAFWDLLRDGVDAITEIPADRWDVESLYDPDPAAEGKLYSKYGGFVDGVDRFDPLFFGISPKEAARLDPQHRMLLEVAWEALEDSGHAPRTLRGSRTGVFVGIAENDYARLIEEAHGTRFDHYDATGTGFCFASGRISHVLGLQGPNVAMDTGCSSSLVAIHQAVSAIRLGECDMALAGGVHLRLSPTTSLSLARTGALAPDGRCKTFDARADGFGRSEGCGLIVLKRLSDAQRDGDTVLAVVRGSAVNHDGPASGFTVPNQRAQVSLIRSALGNAGVEPDEVGYVETHGTGTSLGDPIEVGALATVFGGSPHPVLLGAVKSNIGHTEGAAGIAGVIKAVLALRHQEIPGNVHFDEPNPYIDWENLPFTVPTAPVPWPGTEGGARVAGVSSFGMSGTNAHVVLGAAPAAPARDDSGHPARLLTLSGRTERALADAAGQLAAFVAGGAGGASLADVCFTANTGRDHFEHRRAVVAATPAELVERLTAGGGHSGYVPVHRPAPGVAFLFTGQGSQYAGMAQELYASEPVFREAVDRCAEVLDRHLDRPLLSVLHPADPAHDDLLDRTGYTQPALFAVEYALTELWRSWGVTPDVVLGHSVGGLVAACVAGVFSLDDALLLVAERGRLMQGLEQGGVMVSLRGDEAVVAAAVAAHPLVSVAAVNAPGEVVVSGAAEQVEAVLETLAEQGVQGRRLSVSHAFHSPLMAPIAEPFRAVARRVRYARPRIAVVSDLTGRLADADELCDPEYWVRHALDPVRFADGVRAAHATGARAFVEIGPKPVLLGLGRACLTQSEGDDVAWVPSLRPGRDRAELLSGAAALHVYGVPVDLAAVDGRGDPRRVPLPTYPFQRERHWFTAPARAGRTPVARVRPLLDTEIRLPMYRATVFQSELGADSVPFLAEHRVGGALVSPAACHLAMAASAVEAVSGEGTVVLTDVVFPEALVVPDEGTRTVQLSLTPRAGGAPGQDFQLAGAVHGADEDAPVHATGQAALQRDLPPAETVDVDALRSGLGREVDADELYARLADHGIELGPVFRRLGRIWTGADEVLATVTAAPTGDPSVAPVHPGLLDALFQATEAVALADGERGEARLPFAVARLRLDPGAGDRAHWIHARRTGAGPWDIRLLDGSGTVVAEVEGFEDRPAPRDGFSTAPAWADWLVGVEWGEAAGEVTEELGGRWLVRGAGAGVVSGVRVVGDLVEADHVVFVADAVPAPGVDVADRALELSVGLLELVQELAAGGRPVRLRVVTRGGQAVVPGDRVDPAQAALWGLVRTVRAEHPELECSIVDLDADASVEDGLRTSHALSAVRGALRLTPALTPVTNPTSTTPVRLVLDAYGSPDHLRAHPLRRREPRAGEVEIEVAAAGLNFRDVLISLGMMREHYATAHGIDEARDIPLGFECAGVVAAVGPEVTGLAVGDPVMAMAEGGFADYVTVRAQQVAALPDGLTPAEGATIPLAFLTAHYALTRLAGLRRGERVLIHAASGGVGSAAVQIARAVGAEVYATASEAKRDAVRAMGVTHVLDSRSTSFADDIAALTDGQGVDVVLNSLNGEFIPASLNCLAKNGRFVDMGKLGVWSPERMRAERPDAGYFPFDLGDDAELDATLLPGLFAELNTLFAAGELRPLPMTVFPRHQATRAYTYMQHTKHTGKIVLLFEGSVGLSSDASYLVTGGLGGLGLRVGEWLAREGAGHVVLAGRSVDPSGLSGEVRRCVGVMEGFGARVSVVAADVSCGGDVERLVAVAEGVAPLRGVVHAAGVLDDGVLGGQSASRFGGVFAPKVRGGVELDRVVRERGVGLDFFVAFSSVAALLEDGGQGNYAAANAFLDGLMASRRAQGLPGLSVNWGPWAEVGMAAHLAERLTKAGSGMIPPDQGVDALRALLGAPVAQIGVMPTVRAPRPEPTRTAPPAATETWPARLAAEPAEGRRDLLRHYLEQQLTALLELPTGYRIDGHAAFSELGMDSLMVVGLRNRLQSDLDVALGSTVAFNYPTVEQLVGHLLQELALDTTDAADATGASVPPPARPLDDLRADVDRELDLLINDDEDMTP
ncbi:type I polyketide synthase [Streptomyces sp. NPDC006632]|uniref:type I polyketide synthase n=1 Tax=Streptomyces sp. NPDC006632 TaxID=3157182 RepID=UPI00339FA0D8